MGSFSIWHWLIVLAIIMLVFGTKKLRSFGADLGGAVQGFKQGMKEGSFEESADAAGAPKAVHGARIEGGITEKSRTSATS